MPYLTRHQLIHAKDKQLNAIGLRRKQNAGWLKKALKTEFSVEQIEAFTGNTFVLDAEQSAQWLERLDQPPRIKPKLQKIFSPKSGKPEIDQAIADHIGQWANNLYESHNRNLAPIAKP